MFNRFNRLIALGVAAILTFTSVGMDVSAVENVDTVQLNDSDYDDSNDIDNQEDTFVETERATEAEAVVEVEDSESAEVTGELEETEDTIGDGEIDVESVAENIVSEDVRGLGAGDSEICYMEAEEEMLILEGEADNDARLNDYLYKSLITEGEDPEALGSSEYNGKKLTGTTKNIYTSLKEMVTKVAAGEASDTAFQISMEDVWGKDYWTAEELGVTELTTNAQAIGLWEQWYKTIDQRSALRAVTRDCPYEMYWADLASSVGRTGFSYQLSDKSGDGKQDLVLSDSYITISVTVSPEYDIPETREAWNFSDGTVKYYSTKVDTTKTSTIASSVAYANTIVSTNSSYGDYEKLDAYMEAICGLNVYNHDAASDSYTGGYGNPWQIIYVFDQNPDTNVVCEGYSKAFQYLCDLSTFNSDIDCYCVSGKMGTENHMWNIVHMDDDKRYLVDVTNCDWDEQSLISKTLFIVPCTSGSVNSGYVYHQAEPGYTPSDMTYTYDEDTKKLYNELELTISTTSYDAPSCTLSIGASTEDFSDETAGYSYDASTRTLILKNALINGSTDFTKELETKKAAIYLDFPGLNSSDAFNIIIEGDNNRISGSNNYGIYFNSNGELKITGNGSLSVSLPSKNNCAINALSQISLLGTSSTKQLNISTNAFIQASSGGGMTGTIVIDKVNLQADHIVGAQSVSIHEGTINAPITSNGTVLIYTADININSASADDGIYGETVILGDGSDDLPNINIKLSKASADGIQTNTLKMNPADIILDVPNGDAINALNVYWGETATAPTASQITIKSGESKETAIDGVIDFDSKKYIEIHPVQNKTVSFVAKYTNSTGTEINVSIENQVVARLGKVTNPGTLAAYKDYIVFDHYTLNWYTSDTIKNNTTLWDCNEDLVRVDMTLYAGWVPDQYTLTFDANGGIMPAGADNTLDVYYGNNYPDLPTPTKTGYTFDGWWIEAEQNEGIETDTLIYGGTCTVNITQNVNVTAHWLSNAKSGTLGATISWSLSGDSTKGYELIISGSGALPDYSEFSKAPWAAYSIQIKSAKIAKDISNIGTGLFLGCPINGDGTPKLIIKGYPDSAAKTFADANGYTFKSLVYTLTFTSTYGLFENGTNVYNMQIEEGQTFGTLPVMTRTGYTCGIWYKSTDYENGKITAQTVYSESLGTTFYCSWSANSYEVTFDYNDGITEPTNVNLAYDGTYGDLPAPARTGYTFIGWFTEKNEAGLIDTPELGTQVLATTVLKRTSPHTLYAYWKYQPYTLTFNAGGGFITADGDGTPIAEGTTTIDRTRKYDDTFGPFPIVTKEGYNFMGWYLEGTSTKVENTEKYEHTSNLVLVANWTANTYMVIYDYNDGTGATVDRSCTYGAVYGDLPVVSRTGYEFLGWFSTKTDTAESTGVKIESGTPVTVAANHTLYARWQEDWGEDLDNLSPEVKAVIARKLLGDGKTWSDLTIEDIPEGLWSVGVPESVVYNGKAWNFNTDIIVFHNTEVLKMGTDYQISYKNNLKAYDKKDGEDGFVSKNAPTVTIKGKGNYAGTVSQNFVIHPLDLSTADVYAPTVYLVWNNKNKQQLTDNKMTVTMSDERVISLKKKTDYNLVYPDTAAGAYMEAGTYTVRVEGTGNYTGFITFSEVISTQDTQASKLSIKVNNTEYNPVVAETTEGIIPAFTVKSGKITYVIGAGAEGAENGYMRMVVDADNGSSWSDLLGMEPSVLAEKYASESNLKLLYHVTKNKSAGTAQIEFLGIPKAENKGISGTVTKTFKISPVNLKKVTVEGFNESVNCETGRSDNVLSQNGVSLKYTVNETNKTLSEGTDFTTKYQKNTGIGKATVTYSGKGNYTGSIKKTYSITGKSLADKNVVEYINISNDSYQYTGSEIVHEKVKNSQIIKDVTTGRFLKGISEAEYGDLDKNNTDSESTNSPAYYDYIYKLTNNINKGTAKVTFRGINAYDKSVTKTFKIVTRTLSDAEKNAGNITIEMPESFEYTKGGVKPQPVVKVKSINNPSEYITLELGRDYTLSYKDNNKFPKTTTGYVTITGKGGYAGKLSPIPFTITQRYINIDASAGGDIYNGLTITATDFVYQPKVNVCVPAITIVDNTGTKLVAGTDYQKLSIRNGDIRYAENRDDITSTEVVGNYSRSAGELVADTDIVPVGAKLQAVITFNSDKGMFSGSARVNFKVVQADISKFAVTAPKSAQYNGAGRTVVLNPAEIIIRANKNTEPLVYNRDYTIEFTNNTRKGKATATIKGIGNYSGSKNITYSIVSRSFVQGLFRLLSRH